jgi:hypothetical protein
MSPRSSRKLAEYLRLTLQLVEQSPRRASDNVDAAEFKFLLQRRITELEGQVACQPARSMDPAPSTMRTSQ